MSTELLEDSEVLKETSNEQAYNETTNDLPNFIRTINYHLRSR